MRTKRSNELYLELNHSSAPNDERSILIQLKDQLKLVVGEDFELTQSRYYIGSPTAYISFFVDDSGDCKEYRWAYSFTSESFDQYAASLGGRWNRDLGAYVDEEGNEIGEDYRYEEHLLWLASDLFFCELADGRLELSEY